MLRRETFESVDFWIKEVKEHCDEGVVCVLCGNQADRAEDRVISYEEGERKMKEKQLNFFFETSAKDGSNIEKAFTEAGKQLFLQYLSTAVKQSDEPQTTTGGVDLKSNGAQSSSKTDKSNCC